MFGSRYVAKTTVISTVSCALMTMTAACTGVERMVLSGEVAPPQGYVDFCIRNPAECKIPLTNRVLTNLKNVNRAVNDRIQQKEEAVDIWDLAEDGDGDCEDFVLLKRKYLRELYPAYAAAFRIALVWTELDQYHAVLTVHTFDGVYVLDSRYQQVAIWNSYPYIWSVMESPGSQKWSIITTSVK